MKTLIPLVALLLLTTLPASAESYRMLVNADAGWLAAGDFGTLEECKREAALYATKHSVQAGCAAVRALEQADRSAAFQQASKECSRRSRIDVINKPGDKITTFGTQRQQFNFEKCMSEKGQHLE